MFCEKSFVKNIEVFLKKKKKKTNSMDVKIIRIGCLGDPENLEGP